LGNHALIVIARLPEREASQSHKGRSPGNIAFKPFSIARNEIATPDRFSGGQARIYGYRFLWIIRLLLPYGFVLELPFLKPLDYESA